MTDPIIHSRAPKVVDLAPGDYAWCACGRSANQPFCDGAHKGTGLAPVRFTITTPQKVALCCCKHTADRPRCDGTHRTL
ncbi:MAG: CDGSH iron-sulfur domain-containing protein [Planctomycetes bacterium]|nr:CDGSH iron-sulfur domain-containing protein [Planctomycetota bacterium]